MNVLNAREMQAADAHAIQEMGIPSLTLMENAATQVVRVMTSRFPTPGRATVVCGRGNNGGDGMAVARLLQERGWQPAVVLVGSAAGALKADPAVNWKRALEAGVQCTENASAGDLARKMAGSALVIDAMFGTGLGKPLEGIWADAVAAVNAAECAAVCAIDVPSGLSSDTGRVIGPTVRADFTVALAAPKFCHILSPACLLCGELYVTDIGIPASSTTSVVRCGDVREALPQRRPDSHKGTYGHAGIVAGSTGKSGAAYMAGKAALRAGAGLSTIFSPSAVQAVIAASGPEVMTHRAAGNPDCFSKEAVPDLLQFAEDKTACAIGPGIGKRPETLEFLQGALPALKIPVVVDADGLNLVAEDKSILRYRAPGTTVLTPHPGEMARLLGVSITDVQRDRIDAAVRLAGETGSIVALKGYRTVIAGPSGDVWINPTGGQSLASAGTGDILTGVLAGFIAQRMAPIQATKAAVYAHGLAGNLFETEYPQQALNAMDIVAGWNLVLREIRSGKDLESEYLKLHFQF